jgi:hypothetical protein
MRKRIGRMFPVPEGYPVAGDAFPDMPVEIFHLQHTGRVTAADYARWGWRAMRCADCEERDLELHFMHPPLRLEEFTSGRVLPGTIWGKDVSPVCPCCSFPSKCPHKDRPRNWRALAHPPADSAGAGDTPRGPRAAPLTPTPKAEESERPMAGKDGET